MTRHSRALTALLPVVVIYLHAAPVLALEVEPAPVAESATEPMPTEEAEPTETANADPAPLEAVEPEPTPPAAADRSPTAGAPRYAKGFVLVDERDFSLKIGMINQLLYAASSPSDELGDPTTQSFSVRRIRLKLGGQAFGKIGYNFMGEFRPGSTILFDAWLDAPLIQDVLHLRAGRWKTPFARQFINAVWKLAFVDHAITHKSFAAWRDDGLALHNSFYKGRGVRWIVGLFNSHGSANLPGAPDHFEPDLFARVVYRHGDIDPFGEADYKAGPLRFAVGLSARSELDQDQDDLARSALTVDGVVKLAGVALEGAIFVDAAEVSQLTGDASRIGGYGQLTYVWNGWLQPGVRYGYVAGPMANDDLQEVTGGITLAWQAHNLKWQTDVSGMTTQVPGAEQVVVRLRSQLQWVF